MIGAELASFSSAVQACSLEDFHGETSCRISDYRQSLGLPLHLPAPLDNEDIFEIAHTLGISGDNTVAFEFSTTPSRKAGARLNIFDSGAGETCLHKECPYVKPGSFVVSSHTTCVQAANGTVVPPCTPVAR